jgi:Ca-activated chloride channel family protein
MQFTYLRWRWLLVVAVAAAVLAVLALLRKRRALHRLLASGGCQPPVHQPGVLVRPGRQIVKCLLFMAATALLGIALLGPQIGWIEEDIPPRSGRDVFIVLDVSRSMLAEDVAPNRLERAKADVRDLAAALEEAGGYRIGLIAFAERAAVLCPLTFDYRCFEEELAAASLGSLRLRGHAAWGDGTQISTALDRAGGAIDDANAAYTDLLLISDGDDMARETLAAADGLGRRGIAVHTLGLGDPNHGSLIPVRDAFGRSTCLRFRDEPVYTHLQEEVLQAIAQRGHGRYFAVGTGYLELDRAFGELLAAKESRERQIVQHQRHGIHRFQWFVAAALLLLMLQWLLSDARSASRTAPEKPVYFRWVRRRPPHPTLSPPGGEGGVRGQRGRALVPLTLAVVFLILGWSSLTRAGPRKATDPWTAFRRGNELLHQAQEAGAKADPAWLIQALRHYQICLARERSTRNAGTLFDDARYNREMAKLLLLQLSRGSSNAGQPDPDAPASDGQAGGADSEDKTDKDDTQNPGKRSHSTKDTAKDADSIKDKQETKEQLSPNKDYNKTDAEKDNNKTEKDNSAGKTDANKDNKETNRDKSDANKDDGDKNKDKQGQQAQPSQQSQQPAKDNKDQSSSRQQNNASQSGGQKKAGGGSSGASGESTRQREDQSKQSKADENNKREKKAKEPNESESKKDKKDAEPKKDASPGQGAPSEGDDDKGNTGQGKTEPKDADKSGRRANRAANENVGAAPSPSDKGKERKRGGGANGAEPDVRGLFHPESEPKSKQRSSGQGADGDSGGGGPSKDKMKQRETDPAMQAAVTRLREAIKRIEKRRVRRALGPQPDPEDPANLRRYRDW